MKPGESRRDRIMRQYGVLDVSHLDFPPACDPMYNGEPWTGMLHAEQASRALLGITTDEMFPDTDEDVA